MVELVFPSDRVCAQSGCVLHIVHTTNAPTPFLRLFSNHRKSTPSCLQPTCSWAQILTRQWSGLFGGRLRCVESSAYPVPQHLRGNHTSGSRPSGRGKREHPLQQLS